MPAIVHTSMRVISGAMASMVLRRSVHQIDFDAAKVRIRELLFWVVREQVLGPQFVADLLKRGLHLLGVGGVKMLATSCAGDLDEEILPRRIAAGAGLHRNDDHAVDD